MSTLSTIIKSLILPIVIKSAKFDVSSAPDTFWEQFASDFVTYETDASAIYSTLYKLELSNPEYIFNQLPDIFSTFMKKIAEEYILGNENELTDKLIESKNATFLKEVSFLNTIKAVITISERNQLKKNLPQAYDRLVFELDEEILRQVAKKKSRENLNTKFKQWDKELVEDKSDSKAIQYSILRESNSSFDDEESIYLSNSKRKIISLSWIKYAVAACIVLTAGIMYFKFNTDNNIVQPIENNVVTTPDKKAAPSMSKTALELPIEALAEVSIVTKNAPVIESDLGFASKNKKIKIVENNQNSRKVSLIKAIENYQKLLDDKAAVNKVGYGTRLQKLQFTIERLQNELALLNKREKHYVFDGKVLEMYVSTTAKENDIILYKDSYYLKRDADFYSLTIATKPQAFKKVTDTTLIEHLYNLYSD